MFFVSFFRKNEIYLKIRKRYIQKTKMANIITKSNIPRQVSFSTEIEVSFIPSLKEFTDETKLSIWWTPQDYQNFIQCAIFDMQKYGRDFTKHPS